jgi:hypothetical protein
MTQSSAWQATSLVAVAAAQLGRQASTTCQPTENIWHLFLQLGPYGCQSSAMLPQQRGWNWVRSSGPKAVELALALGGC